MLTAPASAPPDVPLWRPRPWRASLLSAAAPGAGHLYVGRPMRAGAVAAAGAIWPGVCLLLSCEVTTPSMRIALGVLAVMFQLAIVPLDALMVAGRTAAGYPRWFQQQWVVIGSAFLILGGVHAVREKLVRPLVRTVIFQGNSMFPTVLDQERFVVRAMGGLDIGRGEIVVYEPEPGRHVMHRVIGLPDDVLEMREFRATVNGVAEPSGPRPCLASLGMSESSPAVALETLEPVRVPSGHYVLLGDCRDSALDSRESGFIPRERIHARVVWRYWSVVGSRIGTLAVEP